MSLLSLAAAWGSASNNPVSFGDAQSSSRHARTNYYDEQGWRHWRSCEFQAIGPLDQVIFALLGGRVDKIGSECKVWQQSRHCRCSAPLDMLGRNHTVVEIGANDGLHMSNSRFFDMQLGWRSLCVEANPQVYSRLKVNRPECLNVNTIVAERQDFDNANAVPYISFSRPATAAETGSRDWHTGVSGIESPNASNLEIRSFHRSKEFAKRNNLLVQRDFLPVMPFSELFKKHGFSTIDLLSVDVEGAEHSVIKSIDFAAVKIRMVVVEKPSQETKAILSRAGFIDLDLETRLFDRFYHNRNWFVPAPRNGREW